MFASLLDETDAAIGAFIFDAWTRFIADGRDWVLIMSVLFVVITGYLILVGRLNISLSELFPRLVKWLAVIAIILNFDAMIILIFNLFTNVPEAVATQLADVGGEDSGGINASVGLVWERGLTAAQKHLCRSRFNDMESDYIRLPCLNRHAARRRLHHVSNHVVEISSRRASWIGTIFHSSLHLRRYAPCV